MAMINDAWLFAPQSYWFFIVAVFVVTNDLLPTPRYKRGAEEFMHFVFYRYFQPTAGRFPECPYLRTGLQNPVGVTLW
ncbi:hypothetical protein [Maribellus sediminis]|uniref:hypothetical protein n=1 Tax=Maribellus sediminis TaxID=2696285 RepID=UPI0014316163|nr:hypothetical protein [Maribellus sediminis]